MLLTIALHYQEFHSIEAVFCPSLVKDLALEQPPVHLSLGIAAVFHCMSSDLSSKFFICRYSFYWICGMNMIEDSTQYKHMDMVFYKNSQDLWFTIAQQ